MSLAWFLPSASTLNENVAHIVAMSAKPEVRRIDAARVVAAWAIVTNFVFVWYLTVMNDVRRSGRRYLPTVEKKVSIAKLVAIGGPEPTLIRTALVNLFPKALHCVFKAIVTVNVAHGLPLDDTALNNGGGGNGCRLSTATHAQSAGVGKWNGITLAVSVARYVPVRFALDYALVGPSTGSYGGQLTASAVAVTIGDFVRRFVRGILVGHEKLAFLVSRHGTIHSRRRGNSIGAAICPHIVSQIERLCDYRILTESH